MKKLLFMMVLFLSIMVWVELKIVMLEVFSMNCVICFVMVKLVLKKVKGVKIVEVIYELNEVIVIFDDMKINIKELMVVIENVGYLFNVKSSD